ncbi:MAG: hypothetical protein HOQ24_02990 [Mycobacteriaceae bacterium]|nr:hypothetical protein [Mycobacteriaceae bacterium]
MTGEQHLGGKIARICKYCTHHNGPADNRCFHCGAPLAAAVEHGMNKLETVEKAALAAAPVVVPAVAVAGIPLIKDIFKNIPQWIAILGLVALVVIAGIFVVKFSSTGPPAQDTATASTQLPDQLRRAASCQRQADGDRCVIAAGDPLLGGDLYASQDMSFTVQQTTVEGLNDAIKRWRRGADEVVEDDSVFAAVGSEGTVWYANTRTGVRLETTAFATPRAARTFLSRSGLATAPPPGTRR